jgi:hypothetical protein
MKLSQVPRSPVILSGAKDPIPAYITTTPARSFCHSLALSSGVSAVRRSSDLKGVAQ